MLICTGGFLSGEMLLNFDGQVNGTSLDESYIPDELDEISAEKAGVTVERLCLDGMPHGFGDRGGRIESYHKFLSNIFE